MIKLGMTVTYPGGGTGTVDRTSTRTGSKLYRVNDKWFEREDIKAL